MGARVIALLDLRAKVAAALEPVDEGDPVVVPEPTDAIVPPCLVLTYAEPWLVPQGQAPVFVARLEVLCIAGRFEPGAGVATLEALLTYAVQRLEQNRAELPVVESASAPRSLELGGVRYLAAGLVCAIPVTVA